MTTVADIIKHLVVQQVDRVKTLDIGIISRVNAYNNVDVKLKHLVEGNVVEYADVSVLPASIGSAKIYSYPNVGETVLIGYLKYEPAPQLEHEGEIATINEQVRYVKPIVIGALTAADAEPDNPPEEHETFITHQSGSSIKMLADGTIAISATHATLNGSPIATEEDQ